MRWRTLTSIGTLYAFAQDGDPGRADGNGVTDSFTNTEFVPHTATMSGSTPTTADTNQYGC